MALSLSVEAAAALLGLSERTVWRKIRAGELPVIREGRRVFVQVERQPGGRRVADVVAPYGTAEPEPWPWIPWWDRGHTRRRT